MAEVTEERVATELEGDFVGFRIGRGVHRLWKVREWFPIFRRIPKVLDELESDPHSGLLAHDGKPRIRNHEFVRYRQSLEKLREYALDPDAPHAPVVKSINRITKESDAVGIWHETYVMRGDGYEAIYHHMPVTGLGKAGTLHPATGLRKTATGRLEQTCGKDGMASEVQ
ncbi:MAG: monooxygenase family protein [Halobacteriota archaeon]